MALHRLASITIGVPNVEETSRYYAEFGLARDGATFSTTDGGKQLCIVKSPTRRLIELCVGADDFDDLDRVVGRTVVADDEFNVGIGLIEGTLNGVPDKAGVIVVRDQNRD